MRQYLILAAIVLSTATAAAHSFYDGYCCQGNAEGTMGDCAPIPKEAVKVVPGGYQITLLPGMHRKVTEPQTYFFEYAKARWSKDERYHACIYPTQKILRCFYHPLQGY